MIVEGLFVLDSKLYVVGCCNQLPPDDAMMFFQGGVQDSTRWKVEKVQHLGKPVDSSQWQMSGAWYNNQEEWLFGPVTKLDGPHELSIGAYVQLVDGMP